MLARRYETVVAEDLNVAAMTRNRHLARAIADQGFGTARRMLGYKTAWSGGRLLLADRFYPSSKTCSGCGAVKAKLALSERIFRCGLCGLVIGRDVNAAANLLSLGTASGAGTGPGPAGANACGAAVRPGPAAGLAARNQEPGTAGAGKTGTVPRQHGTAA
jgi:putative transposase